MSAAGCLADGVGRRLYDLEVRFTVEVSEGTGMGMGMGMEVVVDVDVDVG